jgi:DNA-directed RNA polymerase sigma subunit (sigma70/sigma32)
MVHKNQNRGFKGRHLSRRAIGKLLGISTARVEQLERQALEKLRRSAIIRDVAAELGIRT